MVKKPLMLLRFIISIVGIIIIVDCAVLMAVGKVNFGTVVPFLLGIVFVAHGFFWYEIGKFVHQNRWIIQLWYVLWAMFFI